jgi:hypothetical protein
LHSQQDVNRQIRSKPDHLAERWRLVELGEVLPKDLVGQRIGDTTSLAVLPCLDVQELLQLVLIAQTLEQSAIGSLGDQLDEARDLPQFRDLGNLGEFVERMRHYETVAEACESVAVHVLDHEPIRVGAVVFAQFERVRIFSLGWIESAGKINSVGMGTHYAFKEARCCGEDALVCVDGLAFGTREDEVHIRGFFVVVETVGVSVRGHQQGKSPSILSLLPFGPIVGVNAVDRHGV